MARQYTWKPVPGRGEGERKRERERRERERQRERDFSYQLTIEPDMIVMLYRIATNREFTDAYDIRLHN